MTFEQNFNDLKQIFMDKDVSGIKDFLAFQFNIVGDGEGVFYAELKDGKLSIEPYEYYDNQAKFKATAQVFKDIANGKIDPVKAFLKGKLDVKGDLGKAGELRKLIKNKK